MKRLLAILLLAGCGSKSGSEADKAAGPDAQAAAMPTGASAGQTPQQLQARAAAALSAILNDPASARYATVRPGTAGSICGEVDSKQANGRHGGMRPFVVTPEGVAVVSTLPGIMFEDPEDVFPDYYIRWCASPEELATLPPRIALGTGAETPPPPIAVPTPEELAAMPLPSPPANTAQAPEPKREEVRTPAGTGGAPAAEEDSFFKSVLRKQEESKR
jgi:hypothetical protein